MQKEDLELYYYIRELQLDEWGHEQMNEGNQLSADFNSGPWKRKPWGLRKSLGRSPSAGTGEVPLRSYQLLQAAQSPMRNHPVAVFCSDRAPTGHLPGFTPVICMGGGRRKDTVSCDSMPKLGSCLLSFLGSSHCPSQLKSYLPTRLQLLQARDHIFSSPLSPVQWLIQSLWI